MNDTGLLLGITILTLAHFFVALIVFMFLSKLRKDNTIALWIALTWELSLPLLGVWKLLKIILKTLRII